MSDDATFLRAAIDLSRRRMEAGFGGPFGAIVGAALGAFGGAAVQQGSGHSDAAYVVRHDDGSTQRYRSPNARFKPGDQVQVSGIRLAPAQ